MHIAAVPLSTVSGRLIGKTDGLLHDLDDHVGRKPFHLENSGQSIGESGASPKRRFDQVKAKGQLVTQPVHWLVAASIHNHPKAGVGHRLSCLLRVGLPLRIA